MRPTQFRLAPSIPSKAGSVQPSRWKLSLFDSSDSVFPKHTLIPPPIMLVGCSVKSLNLNLNTSGSKLRTRGRISKLRQANFEQERASKTYGRTLRSSVWIYKPLQNYFERKAGMQNLWKQSSVKGLILTTYETKLRTIAWISKPLNANFGGEAELQNFDSIQFDSIQFDSV